VFSQDSSIISKIASMSASDTGDFLRLARSWLRSVAASGANFSESVAAGAKFCFSSESSASISSRSARSVSSCDRSCTNSWLSFSLSVSEFPNSLCNRWFSERTASNSCLSESTSTSLRLGVFPAIPLNQCFQEVCHLHLMHRSYLGY